MTFNTKCNKQNNVYLINRSLNIYDQSNYRVNEIHQKTTQ